jgi:hypothetical protein
MVSNDPQNWRLDVRQESIDLYVELISEPRGLSAAEVRLVVELVDAWRDLERRKHMALQAARSGSRPTAS